MQSYFVAYSSKNTMLAEIISRAVSDCNSTSLQYKTWQEKDGSGAPIHSSVESWVRQSSGVVADISELNFNVTYEIGFAIGLSLPLKLIRHSTASFEPIKRVGLLSNISHDTYSSAAELTKLLREVAPASRQWKQPKINRDQPVYFVSPGSSSEYSNRVSSSIKKTVREKYRSFQSNELSRINATDLWSHVAASCGVITLWSVGTDDEAIASNHRACLAFGMARGLDIPAMLVAHQSYVLPLDLEGSASKFSNPLELEEKYRAFRDDVAEVRQKATTRNFVPANLLERIDVGDPAAENEQDRLSNYFLDTEEFKSTLSGTTNIVVGRKGSGKSAIFLQARDRLRAIRSNVVVDLSPEGAQLVKLKETVTQITSAGTRKELLSAFWQYVVWLEIAYKLLEKDKRASSNDWELNQKYSKLESAFRSRVDTGFNDFSERLRILIEMITTRFESYDKTIEIKSSGVLEIVYGESVATIRNEILSYLSKKGRTVLLFDNMDRMRGPSGFGVDDSSIIVGLVESMQEMAKAFRKANLDFQWAVFLRSDVYQFVTSGMADYGKLAERLVEWSDRELLIRVLQKRIMAGAANSSGMEFREWSSIWAEVSCTDVQGVDTETFLLDASMMRPRYLIRLFELARNRAIGLGKSKVDSTDYLFAERELGYTIISDLGRELLDIVADTDDLILDLIGLNGACGITELQNSVGRKVSTNENIERVIDVLLWSGCIGVNVRGKVSYIYNCGYKLPILRSLLRNDDGVEIVTHPTITKCLN